MKTLTLLLLALFSFSALAIDCRLIDKKGDVLHFGNPYAWNGTIYGSATAVLSTLSYQTPSAELLQSLKSVDVLIQRAANDDLYAIESGDLFKLVIYKNEKVIASSLTPMSEAEAKLEIPEMGLTLICEKSCDH